VTQGVTVLLDRGVTPNSLLTAMLAAGCPLWLSLSTNPLALHTQITPRLSRTSIAAMRWDREGQSVHSRCQQPLPPRPSTNSFLSPTATTPGPRLRPTSTTQKGAVHTPVHELLKADPPPPTCACPDCHRHRFEIPLTLPSHSHEAVRQGCHQRSSEEKHCPRKGWSGPRHLSCKA